MSNRSEKAGERLVQAVTRVKDIKSYEETVAQCAAAQLSIQSELAMALHRLCDILEARHGT